MSIPGRHQLNESVYTGDDDHSNQARVRNAYGDSIKDDPGLSVSGLHD